LYTLSAGQALTRIYSDRLGSTRTTETIEQYGGGWTTRNYYPFGEEITSTGNDQYKFASTYRDSATGLDYALNRYYASGTARFLTPDPLGHGSAKPTSSISWNLYIYSRNDPANTADPSGLDNEVVNTVFAQGTVDMCFESGGATYYGLRVTTGATTDADGNTVFTRSVVNLDTTQQWGVGAAIPQPGPGDTVSQYTQYGSEIRVTAEVGRGYTQNYAPGRQFLFRGTGWTQLGAAAAKAYAPASLSTTNPYSFSYSAGTWTTTNGGTGQFAYGVGALFQNGQVTIDEGYFETNGNTATLLGISTTFDNAGMLTMSRRQVATGAGGNTSVEETQYFRCGTRP
jgi:RHS repeat-associated protein